MTPEFCRELERYAFWRINQIGDSKSFVETRIEEDMRAFLIRRKQEKIEDASAGKLWYHLEITLGNTLRYALLAGVCGALEECIDQITKEQIPDDKARKKACKVSREAIEAEKGWANWLEINVRLIMTEAQLPSSDQFVADMERFRDVITLRNCISHCWGNVGMDDHPEQVEAAVERIQVEGVRMNCDFVSISPDDYLRLGRDMVSEAICLAFPIVQYVCRAMIDKLNAPAR